jgi:hypothetical protein
MDKPFWETERDLTDSEQKRFEPNTDFESSNPDGAAKSIESASQLDFSPQIEQTLEERAEAIQTIDNDPDKPDRFEDDVYRSQQRAEQALFASFARGLGAAQSTRGVESSVQWGFARVDDFAKTVKSGSPDDAEFTSETTTSCRTATHSLVGATASRSSRARPAARNASRLSTRCSGDEANN